MMNRGESFRRVINIWIVWYHLIIYISGYIFDHLVYEEFTIGRHRISLAAHLTIKILTVTVLGLGPWYYFTLFKLFNPEIHCVLPIVFYIWCVGRWDLFPQR